MSRKARYWLGVAGLSIAMVLFLSVAPTTGTIALISALWLIPGVLVISWALGVSRTLREIQADVKHLKEVAERDRSSLS